MNRKEAVRVERINSSGYNSVIDAAASIGIQRDNCYRCLCMPYIADDRVKKNVKNAGVVNKE